jgi:hypothetical protein
MYKKVSKLSEVSWENEPANEIGVKLETMMYKQSEQLVHN